MYNDVKTNGMMIHYFYICHRKLWLFYNKISMEHNSEMVAMGKLLHDYSFGAFEEKEIFFDELINIDIMEDQYIHEVKLSDKALKPSYMQLIYYLYYLKKFGIIKKGTLRFPKQKKIVEIELTPELEAEIEKALLEIKNILALSKPPKAERISYCKNCSYFELCFAG